MGATFGELKTIFANLYEQTSAPASGADVRNRFINLAAKNITNRYKWSWRKGSGSTTADGSQSVALAEDYDVEGIVDDTLYVGGELWTEIADDEASFYTDDSTVFTVIGDDAEGYQLYFPCAVPDNGSAITYRYYRKHPTLVDDSDKTIIPDAECICNLAVGRFLKSEGENEEAVSWLQDAENGIEDMTSEEMRRKPKRRNKKRRGRNVNDVTQMY